MNRKLTEAEEERYARTADWAEAADEIPDGATVVDATATRDGRKLMEELYGSAEAVERAMGRPSVDGTMTPGHSPIVRVRLSPTMDAALTQRAETEHRKRSDVVREALAAYLKAS